MLLERIRTLCTSTVHILYVYTARYTNAPPMRSQIRKTKRPHAARQHNEDDDSLRADSKPVRRQPLVRRSGTIRRRLLVLVLKLSAAGWMAVDGGVDAASRGTCQRECKRKCASPQVCRRITQTDHTKKKRCNKRRLDAPVTLKVRMMHSHTYRNIEHMYVCMHKYIHNTGYFNYEQCTRPTRSCAFVYYAHRNTAECNSCRAFEHRIIGTNVAWYSRKNRNRN